MILERFLEGNVIGDVCSLLRFLELERLLIVLVALDVRQIGILFIHCHVLIAAFQLTNLLYKLFAAEET